MASSYSFDVVSDVDMQEVDNALNQARKEISQRYDFKNSPVEIELKDEVIRLSAENEFKLDAVKDVLAGKFIKRGISAKALEYQKLENASLGAIRQNAKIIKGISKEKAKDIVKVIKDSKIKVQAQIMDNQLRVTSKDKDYLQQTIQLLKSEDFGIELQFTNYR